MSTLQSPYSSLKAFMHYQKLLDIRQNILSSPIYVRIKPTNTCNQKCYYCVYSQNNLSDKSSGSRDNISKNDYIPFDKMQEIISNFREIGVKAVTFSGGGEPLTYKYIIPTMRQVNDSKIDLSMITNGELLHGEAADILTQSKWVRISLDSTSKELYSKTRGIGLDSFDRVCSNIYSFAKNKDESCELGINYVISHENSNEVYNAVKLLKELGVNHIKFAGRVVENMEKYHAPFKDNVIELMNKAKEDFVDSKFKIINKYEEDFDYDILGKRQYCRCYFNELATVIAADCKVYLCQNKAYSNDGIVGDISKKSFKELWFSDETKEFLRTYNPISNCTHACVHDARNVMLNSFFSLDENHINFL